MRFFKFFDKMCHSTAIETHNFHGKSKPVYCPAQALNRKFSTGTVLFSISYAISF